LLKTQKSEWTQQAYQGAKVNAFIKSETKRRRNQVYVFQLQQNRANHSTLPPERERSHHSLAQLGS